jgi:hypothetical protein
MKNWVKWALLGGGAFLLIKAVKGSSLLGGLAGGLADAPGVEQGDVTYAKYKAAWDKAKTKGDTKFRLVGVRVFTRTVQGIVHQQKKRYTWSTFDGSLMDSSWMVGTTPSD